MSPSWGSRWRFLDDELAMEPPHRSCFKCAGPFCPGRERMVDDVRSLAHRPSEETSSKSLICIRRLGPLWVIHVIAIAGQNPRMVAVDPINDKPGRSLFARKVPNADIAGWFKMKEA